LIHSSVIIIAIFFSLKVERLNVLKLKEI